MREMNLTQEQIEEISESILRQCGVIITPEVRAIKARLRGVADDEEIERLKRKRDELIKSQAAEAAAVQNEP